MAVHGGSFLHRMGCDILNLVVLMFIGYLYFMQYLAFMGLFLFFFADVIWPS